MCFYNNKLIRCTKKHRSEKARAIHQETSDNESMTS